MILPLAGLGVSQKLLEKIEQIAKERQCCKITLEVLQDNLVAQSSYRKFGFTGFGLGNALFWQKKI